MAKKHASKKPAPKRAAKKPAPKRASKPKRKLSAAGRAAIVAANKKRAGKSQAQLRAERLSKHATQSAARADRQRRQQRVRDAKEARRTGRSLPTTTKTGSEIENSRSWYFPGAPVQPTWGNLARWFTLHTNRGNVIFARLFFTGAPVYVTPEGERIVLPGDRTVRPWSTMWEVFDSTDDLLEAIDEIMHADDEYPNALTKVVLKWT